MTPRPLELDYVAAPRRPRWIGLCVLAIGLLAAGALLTRYRDLHRDLAALEAAQGLLNVERRPARVLPKERLDEEARAIDAVMRQLTVPWAQMIEAVEAASTPDVALLQVQPEAQQRTLRLTAEAKSREAMLRYLRRLGGSRALSEVHVVSHQVQLDNPARPVQFAVQASFRSAP